MENFDEPLRSYSRRGDPLRVHPFQSRLGVYDVARFYDKLPNIKETGHFQGAIPMGHANSNRDRA